MNKVLISLLLLFPVTAFCQSDYDALKREIIAKRDSLTKLFDQATADEKDSIIRLSRDFLFERITNGIFPSWYGTPWDFNGHSRIPQQGYIACGYFVTNVLLDAGFDIPRYTWAQSASEYFIKKLTPKEIKRFYSKPISQVGEQLKAWGTGLYIVGLDNHVGYIVVKGDVIRFVHSNYYNPDIGVMSEEIDSGNPLSNSSYRVIGKLLTDEMIANWLQKFTYE